MVKGRHRQERGLLECPHPRDVHEGVGFVLGVGHPRGTLVGSGWNLVVIAARRGHEPQLVRRRGVEDERSEAPAARLPVVLDIANRRLQTEVAPVHVGAGVVREAPGVVAHAELIVGLVVAAGARDQLRLAVALEPRARNHVEDAVGAIAVFGAVAAALHLHVVDVFRVELGADVAGDVGVGHRHAVDEPGDLVSAPQVQLIVGGVRARDERGNGLEAVRAVGPGRPRDVFTIHEGRRRHRSDPGRLGARGDGDRLADARDLQRDVEHPRRARHDRQGLLGRREPLQGRRQRVVSDRHRREDEPPVRVGDLDLLPRGRPRLQGDGGARNRAMLRVVNDPLHETEDRRPRRRRRAAHQPHDETGRTTRTHGSLLCRRQRGSRPVRGRTEVQADWVSCGAEAGREGWRATRETRGPARQMERRARERPEATVGAAAPRRPRRSTGYRRQSCTPSRPGTCVRRRGCDASGTGGPVRRPDSNPARLRRPAGAPIARSARPRASRPARTPTPRRPIAPRASTDA